MKRAKRKTTKPVARKHSTRRTPAKKTAARRSRPKAISLHAASVTKRAKVMKALQRVMKAHGVVDRITIHVPRSAVAPQGCPKGQVSRLVCFTRADGTLVCESRCEPI
jgi:hypothetical protein